jgi:hypothetical protein
VFIPLPLGGMDYVKSAGFQNYYYVPSESAHKLYHRFYICDAPIVVIIRPDDYIATINGREDIQSMPLDKAMDKWKHLKRGVRMCE